MEIPEWFLFSVLQRSRVDEVVPWRAVCRQWRLVITSREFFLWRTERGLPVEPLLLHHLGLLFGSPDVSVARYSPSHAVDAAPLHTEMPVAMVDAESTPAELDYETTFSILLRCRPSDLVAWRLVCKEWRAIISCRRFILAHRDQRAPAAMLLLSPNHSTYLRQVMANPSAASTIPDLHTLYIESLQYSSTGPSSLPLLWIEGKHRLLKIYACVDGVILLSYNGHLFAINPVIRRGILLPPVHTQARVLALYHGPAHEDFNPDYCLLYCRNEVPADAFRTFSVATRQTQTLSIGFPAASRAVENALHEFIADGFPSHIAIMEVLYWPSNDVILCFETRSAKFTLLPPPPIMGVGRLIQLLEIDGKLALATLGDQDPIVDIWLRNPHWQLRYHIELPLDEIAVHNPFDFHDYYVVSDHGDIIVDIGTLLHFDCNGTLLGRYNQTDYEVQVVPHWLKETLLPLKISPNVRVQIKDMEESDEAA
jgi:hypothetical protein